MHKDEELAASQRNSNWSATWGGRLLGLWVVLPGANVAYTAASKLRPETLAGYPEAVPFSPDCPSRRSSVVGGLTNPVGEAASLAAAEGN